MPNYCENDLTLRGSSEDIDRFFEENKLTKEEADEFDNEEKDLSFHKSVPVPSDQQTCSKQVEEWGTKWDASNVHSVKSESELQYFFMTPWEPPLRWMQKTSQKYPDLEFEIECREPGCDFYFHIMMKNGMETFCKKCTYEDYMSEKYEIPTRMKKVYSILSEYPTVLDKIMSDIYLDDDIDLNNFDQFIDQSEDDVEDEDEDFKYVFQVLQQEIDIEDSDARYLMCDALDEFFNEHKEKELEEIIQLLIIKKNQ